MTYDVIARARRARLRRRRRIAAALAVLAAAAVTVVVQATQGHRGGTGGSPTGPVPGGTTVSASPDASGAMPEPGTGAALPEDLAWVPVAGVPLPVSALAGPYDTTGGLARGFAHDRAGAVLAAVHLLVRVSPQVGPAVFEATLRDQVSGPAVPALRAQVTQQYQQLCDQARVACGSPIGVLPAVLRGYRIDVYTDTAVTLRVLTEADAPGTAPLYAATVVQLLWIGTDWSLLAPDGGVWNRSITKVAPEGVGAYHPFTAGR